MKNEYYVCGNEVFLKLQSKMYGSSWTIIDLDSLEILEKLKVHWILRPNKYTDYVTSNRLYGRTGPRLHLHRVVMKLKHNDPMEPDHINGNGLDNRKDNLRIVTRAENNFNKRLQTNNKSGIVGVFRRNPTGPWQAGIKINGKNIYLGNFYYKADAIEARSKAEDAYLP